MSADDVKGLRLTMRVSNNRMKRLREERGLSVVEAAAGAGVSHGAWYGYESLRAKPFGLRGGFARARSWRPAAEKIATFLGVTPEWLWPEATLAVVQPTVVAEIDAEDLAPQLVAAQLRPELPAPDDAAVWTEDRDRLVRCLARLTPREEHIIRERFGFNGPDKKCAEIASDFEISAGRVNMIEIQALRKLQYLIKRDEGGW